MPNFRYEVIDAAGKTKKGVIEATNLVDATKMLKVDGKYISKISADNGPGFLSKDMGNPRLKSKDLMLICRQLSSLLTAGITIIRALDMLYQQTESKKAKAVIGSIYEAIQSGKTLSEAFREQSRALPDIMISMISAGEESGRLDDVMNRLSSHFEKDTKLRNKVGQAMVYPVILAIVTAGITLGLMIFIVPKFSATLADLGAEMPAITLFVMNISNSLISFWYIYALIVFGIVFAFKTFTRSEKGAYLWDSFKLKLPIVGKSVKATAAARFTRTMATLLRSGINVLESMEITSRTLGNKVLENRLYDARNDIRKGSSISRSIRGISEFPPMIYAMTAIGEESGTLDSILDKAADFFEEEADTAIGKVTAAMEPIMIIVMAVVVLFIVIAVGAPVMSITQNIL